MRLRDYQTEGVRFLLSKNRVLLGDEPGLGKTAQAICAADCLGDIRVLVLCPKSVCLNWRKEIAKWGTGFAKFDVFNWDKLVKTEFFKGLPSYDLIIADECHTAVKSWKAKRCINFLNFLFKTVDKIWFLSATPATRSAADYHPILSMMQPGKWGKFSAFEKKHCFEKIVTIKNWKRNTVIKKKVFSGFRELEPIKAAFKEVALKRYKRDVAKELPPSQRIKIYVDPDRKLIAESLKLNPQVVEQCVERGISLPAHIASVVKTIGQSKVESALDWIESFPEEEPLVIFAWHQEVVTAIAQGIEEKLDQKAYTITGETPSIQRQAVVDAFRNGEIKRIVLNMQAGGTGIDGLQVASNALFIEFPWSPSTLYQAEGRIERLGSKGDCINYYQMVAAGTIDEVILDSLLDKTKGMEAVGI